MAERFRFDQRGLTELFTSPTGEVAKILLRKVVKVDRTAKRLCPVDTGRLRSSITNAIEVDHLGLVGVIGTDVNYAPYVELGTSRAPAQPFLRPALGAAVGR